MTDFKSEMREVLEKYKYPVNTIGNPSKIVLDIDSALSSLLALIEKNLPKEEENVVETCCTCNCYKAGFNQCLSEIKKEMGI